MNRPHWWGHTGESLLNTPSLSIDSLVNLFASFLNIGNLSTPPNSFTATPDLKLSNMTSKLPDLSTEEAPVLTEVPGAKPDFSQAVMGTLTEIGPIDPRTLSGGVTEGI